MNNLDQNGIHPDAPFWNRIAKRYAKKSVPDQEVYETKLSMTAGYLKPSDRVLEIGCGTGTTAIHHAPAVSGYLAIDISEHMIKIAREKAMSAQLGNLRFEVSSIDELRTTPDSFDVIQAHSILHLLPGLGRVLAQLAQLLVPGGLFICSVPCIRDFFPLFRYVAPLGRVLGILPRVNVFSETQLKQWLANSGFDIVERWQPNPKSGVFIVARKPDRSKLEEKAHA